MKSSARKKGIATALICAREGSKGLPGKNTRLLASKPLIAWAIEHALAVDRINRIIVSTDSEEIASLARKWGAQVPFMRPPALARDDSPEWLVWRHALGFLRETEGAYPDALVVVPATAPLRTSVDIENCLDEFEKGDGDIVITMTDAHRNPYFNMVKRRPDGTVELVVPAEAVISRRQEAPAVYDMTTVAYVVRPQFVMTHDSVFEGRVRAVHVPRERSIDIDTALDLKIAECLLNNRE
jgi:N-acylneuraminate cytidylyltransferase